MDEERERAIRVMPVLMRERGIDDKVAEFWRLWVNALRGTQPRLLAYLSYMVERLLAYLSYMVERLLPMKLILKPTGSIYLHGDPTASHYLKVMMDAIFGHENFRSEITWRRTSSHNDSKGFGQVRDIILSSSKTSARTWNPVYVPHDEKYMSDFYRHEDEKGRYRLHEIIRTASMGERPNLVYEYKGYVPRWGWRMKPAKLRALDREGRLVWSGTGRPDRKTYLSGGRPATNLWNDIDNLSGRARERMAYATQKPLALLERIIKTSSNEGDVVFDPFCGCATTLEAAHRLGRRWVGIDIAIHAVKRVAKVRLQDRLRLVVGKDFEVDGVPRTLEGARDLWKRDPYHFQKWAVETVDGFVTTRRTADGGIDGRLYFAMPNVDDLQSMAMEVKGGKNVGIATRRALRGVLENDAALRVGLIILEPLGVTKERNFHRFMAEAGDTQSTFARPYPRMQLRTVEDILNGKGFDVPVMVARGTGQGVLLSL